MNSRCRTGKKLGSATALAFLLLLPSLGLASDSHNMKIAAEDKQNRVFVSLSYAPTFGGITDFKVGEAYDEGTRALVPYLQGERATVLSSDNFDWMATDTKISFGNSSKNAIAGSIGVKLRGGGED